MDVPYFVLIFPIDQYECILNLDLDIAFTSGRLKGLIYLLVGFILSINKGLLEKSNNDKR